MPQLSPANQAIEEIKAILAKYDLAGMIAVCSPDELAFLNKVDPSWSCAYFQDEECNELRIRAKLADYPSQEARIKAVEDTVGMFMAFQSEASRQDQGLSGMIGMISQQFEISHIERMD